MDWRISGIRWWRILRPVRLSWEVAVGSVSQAQGFIQFSNGQETGV